MAQETAPSSLRPTTISRAEWPSVSTQTKDEAARLIARTLLQKAEGGRRNPATWRRVAEAFGLHALEFHAANCGATRGEYLAASASVTGIGVIAVNTAYSHRQQAGTWVHELAHHILHDWYPPQLHDASDVYHYSDEADEVHHQIARRVERIIFGKLKRASEKQAARSVQ